MAGLTKGLIEFFKKSDVKEALQKSNFVHLYSTLQNMGDSETTGLFTGMMLEAGVDPLKYLVNVPRYYLFDNGDIKHVNIPEDCLDIGAYAFTNCFQLDNVVLPPDLQSIGKSAFKYTGLTSIKIPQNVSTIWANAFCFCENLEKVEFAENSKCWLIERNAFRGCKKLQSITLPDNLRALGDNAFAACYELKEIDFPESVREIGDNIFAPDNKRGIIRLHCVKGSIVDKWANSQEKIEVRYYA